MATEAEVRDVLQQRLEQTGALDGVRARLRAEVFQVIADREAEPPRMSREQLVINELIREYLGFHKLGYTESVFVPETGLGAEPLSRGYVASELNLEDTPQSSGVPLLYGIVSLLMDSGIPVASVGKPQGDGPAQP
eukprot:m.20172 g.20172  ORF g.20172 m.20172 type:complete len:136 (-) comp5540_c0_seq1:206-613(-)